MNETKWYCQRGTDQFGPLSDDELKEEVIAKRISGVDLLWHAGLPGWVQAITIDGLFSNEWQFESAGRQVGPVTLEQLREAVRRGHIPGDALVWSNGLTVWTPVSEVLGLLPSLTVDTPPGPSTVTPKSIPVVAAPFPSLALPGPRFLSVCGAPTSASASVDVLTRLGWYVGKNWETHYRSVFERLLAEDAKGSPVGWTWNWSAALIPTWFIFRRFYSLFLGFFGLWCLIGLLGQATVSKGRGGAAVIALFYLALVFLQGHIADRLLFRKAVDVVNAPGAPVDPGVLAELGKPNSLAFWLPLGLVGSGILLLLVGAHGL